MTGVCVDCVVGRINRITKVVQRLNRIRLMISGCATNRWRQLTPRFSGSPTLASKLRIILTPKLSEYGNNFPLSETTFRRWKVPAFHYLKLLIGGSFTW